MTERLAVVAAFAALMAVLYIACMRLTPGRGWGRALERLGVGAALFGACCAAFALAGVRLAQGPLGAVSAGLLGLPGAAFAALAQLLP